MPPMETVKIFDNSGKVIANVSAVTLPPVWALQHPSTNGSIARCLVDAPH